MSLDSPLNRLGRRRRSLGRARFGTPGRDGRGAGTRSGATATARQTATATRSRLRRRPDPARARLLLAIVAALVVLGGGYALVRNSALVRVEQVRVIGVDSSAEPSIDRALDAAARGMTTLHVREDALRRAVAGFPSVAGLRVRTHLPHGMTIEVLERRPVAVLTAGDQRIAVSADGRLLRDVKDTMGLPAIGQDALPAGISVSGPRTRAALAVANAAPAAVAKRAQRIVFGPKGLTVQLLDGPPLIFGDSTQVAAKWAGATRVMADPTAAGATYLDLREPGRVSAGGQGPVDGEDPMGDAEQPVPGAAATPVPAPVATATPYSQP
jgi:cell division protein FtsQ